MVTKLRKRGRPAETPGQIKRAPLNMRTTQAIRDRLEGAANQSGRSLVQEVEHRIERTFAKEDETVAAFGGAELHALFRMFGAAANLIEKRTGQAWATDRETFIAVEAAWKMLIVEVRPPIPKKWKDRVEKFEREADHLSKEMPTMPDVPVLSGRGGLLGKPSDAEVLESKKQWSDFEMAWSDHLEKTRKAMEIIDYMGAQIPGPAELGEGVAKGLLRPARDK